MTKRLLLLLIFVLTILAMSTSSCTHTKPIEHEPIESESIVVGFSLATLKEDRWIRDRDIFLAKAKQEGLEVIFKNANNNSDIQLSQVEEMLEAGIDVLVIAPNDSADAARCVSAAKEKNVPVISYDRLILESNVDAYISFDNIKVGTLEATHLTESVPNGGYIILNGSEDDNNSSMFNKGYMSVLTPLIEDDKIHIIAETWVEAWTREIAFEFVATSLKDHRGEVKAILCANDSLAWGAIDAISEARMTGQVVVVGHDADLVACQRIVDGTQLMTVYKPIHTLVSKTIEVCLELANNGKTKTEHLISDGVYDVPYVMLDVIVVTKDNMLETVVKDGFHLEEDIYRLNG